jgi:hypothetical protein
MANQDFDWLQRVPEVLQDPAARKQLSDPCFTLPRYGYILDQESDTEFPFRNDICPPLQNTILSYIANPPRQDSGHTKALAVVGPRQSTKTTTAVIGLECKVAYNPGTLAVTIADNHERAEELFGHAMFMHQRLPESIRMPTVNTNAVRLLNYVHGGRYRALTAGGAGNAGLGRGVAFTHISEGPFHPDFSRFWNKYWPAITNRKNAATILESTPAPMSEPSAEDYRDAMMEAREGRGRWLYCFVPFWNSILNERPWDPRWKLSKEEVELLNQHGPKDGGPMGRPKDWRFLTLENLAFLRETRIMDPKVRKDPDLIWVFYPKDDITCWHQTGGAAFPSHALNALVNRSGGPDAFIPWAPDDDCYMEYQAPRGDAVYIIGADPAGWGAGDQASFQVLEVWTDRVIQVAEFSSNIVNPKQFALALIEAARHYNDATVVCENNGVSGATIALLQLAEENRKLRRLHYYAKDKPGVPMSARRHEDIMGAMLDYAMDVVDGGEALLRIKGKSLLDQLTTYKQDKVVEPGIKTQILVPGSPGKRRRQKHHWDRVSAFLWAIFGVKENLAPRRSYPRPLAETEVDLTLGYPADWDQARRKKSRGLEPGLVSPRGRG